MYKYSYVMKMEILLPILQLLIPHWIFRKIIMDDSPSV